MPAGITGYELKLYSAKISNTIHPQIDGRNIQSNSSKRYVLNLNIIKNISPQR
jgi:hypothetical protein